MLTVSFMWLHPVFVSEVWQPSSLKIETSVFPSALVEIYFLFVLLHLFDLVPVIPGKKKAFFRYALPVCSQWRGKSDLKGKLSIQPVSLREELHSGNFRRNQPFLWWTIKWKVLELLSVRLSSLLFFLCGIWTGVNCEHAAGRIMLKFPNLGLMLYAKSWFEMSICQFLPPALSPTGLRGVAVFSKARQGPTWALVPVYSFHMFSVPLPSIWMWTPDCVLNYVE